MLGSPGQLARRGNRPGPAIKLAALLPTAEGVTAANIRYPRPPAQRPADQGEGPKAPQPNTTSCCRCSSGSGRETPTLAARADLAWSTGEAKDTVEARDQFAALLPVVEQVLGPEDPLTLNVRAGLARWTGSKSGVEDAAGARDQFAALLPVYERILGPGTRRRCISDTASPAGQARRGTRPRLETSMRRCYPSKSGYLALTTRTPGLPKKTSTTGPRRRIPRRTSYRISTRTERPDRTALTRAWACYPVDGRRQRISTY